MKASQLRELIRELIQGHLDEMSTTGALVQPGGQQIATTKAFTSMRDWKKVNKNRKWEESVTEKRHDHQLEYIVTDEDMKKSKFNFNQLKNNEFKIRIGGHGKEQRYMFYWKEDGKDFDWEAGQMKNTLKKALEKIAKEKVPIKESVNDDDWVNNPKVDWDGVAKEVADKLKGGYWPQAIKKGVKNITPEDIGSVLIAGGYTTNSGIEKNIGGIMDKVLALVKESINESFTIANIKDAWNDGLHTGRTTSTPSDAERKWEEFKSRTNINESINESYRRFKKKVTNPRQQMNNSVREIEKHLREVDKIVEYNLKLKTEMDLGGGNFFAGTNKRLARISERINHLNNKLKELGN